MKTNTTVKNAVEAAGARAFKNAVRIACTSRPGFREDLAAMRLDRDAARWLLSCDPLLARLEAAELTRELLTEHGKGN